MTFENYSLFGLRVRSEIPLPELFEARPGGAADVTIRLGAVPVIDGSDGRPAVDGDALLLHISGIARYRIAGGDTIVVDPEPGVPDRNIRLYLLGSAFGALLHQRGLLPLHANAIEVDGKAVAFMGASGAGKSTLAAWFHDRGHRVISDDVCVVSPSETGRAFADDACVVSPSETGRAFAIPGLPRLRLWQDALQATSREAAGYDRSYVGDDLWDKFDVPISIDRVPEAPIDLAAIYLLDQGETATITRISGVAAAEAVFDHTYRGAFVPILNADQGHWSSCVRLISQVPIFRFERLWGQATMDEQNLRVLEHARGLLAA